jgi:quinoprotein glucose dehydrogenase
MPGDKAWPTQPIPSKPAPFDRQGVTEKDLIDWTPQLHAQAKEMLKDWNYGPLYTPPSDHKTLLMPGWVGGASWAGGATDPETGMLYVASVTTPMWLALTKPDSPNATVNYKIGENGYKVDGPQGLPLFKGPYGRITAIDIGSGEHRWMKPLGDGPRNHPALKNLNLPPLGRNRRGYLVVTKTVLLAIQEGNWFNEAPPEETPKLRAFDKRTGELLGEIDVPAPATGAPITYMAGGKQYFVYPTGGATEPSRLIALRLP